MKRWFLALAIIGLIGCSPNKQSVSSGNATNGSAPNTNGELPLVGFAQANSKDPWRQVFNADLDKAAQKYATEFRVEFKDGGGQDQQQIAAVENLLTQGVKVLLISPNQSDPLTPVCERAFNSGVKVVLLDRKISGDKYTCWIGGDNKDIGRKVAEYIARRLNGKGRVLMIQGVANASATVDRRDGAMEVWNAQYPGIIVEEGRACDYEREKARTFMENYLQSNKPFDAIYAHNDEMAIGALKAMEAANYTKPCVIVGVDGCQREMIQLIADGKLDATFVYPNPGERAIAVAAKLLKGESPPKQIVLSTKLITKKEAPAYLETLPR